ncbi:hypothetical protein [Hymenobacter sp. BT188]|uniref:hypothetical protein n=1 Tax=Hymenobacter sp. BT188 TaxID=2763504 RepID=UPI001650EA2F|nr:hypothetical protein [Hymenobacter sp. BT188]
MLSFFGLGSYYMFFENIATEINVVSMVGIAVSVLFVAGVFSVYWFTLIIIIHDDLNKILFIYPFRMKRKTYQFEDIIGFRFKYLNAKINYKSIQLKAKSGEKFLLSDFETANLRIFEASCFKHFELRADKSFRKLTREEHEAEIFASKVFDYEQAKDIKFHLIASILFLIVIGGVSLNEIISNTNNFSRFLLTVFLLCILLVVLIARKLVKVNKEIRRLSLIVA